MPAMQLNTFADASELDQALASFVAEQLAQALRQRPQASLIVSGGRTPTGFFQALRDQALPWNRVTISLADERWVDETHADSNARLVREHLLQGAAAAAQFISLYSPADSPQACAQAASQRLAQIEDAFDVVILGMGEDGHTASFFPDSPQLAAALAADATDCLAVTGSKPPPQRLTLSAARLLRARHVVLHITGQTKWRVLGQAMSGGSVDALPMRVALRASQPEKHLFWAP